MPIRTDKSQTPVNTATPSSARLAPSNERFTAFPGLANVLNGAAIGQGTKSPGVKAVQQALIDMGFALGGGADGDFGGQTEKAIRNFQVHASSTHKDVQVTGKLDAATMKALDALAPPPGKHGERGLPTVSTYDGKPIKALVVKNEHRTFLFNGKGEITDIFPNAVGKEGSTTDVGLKKVTGKLGEADAAALGKRLWGDSTVFGPRIVDLSWADGRASGEELHGTNSPEHLGENVSHGCMRHDNADILKIYEALKVGDKVAVVDWMNDAHLGPAKPKTARESENVA